MQTQLGSSGPPAHVDTDVMTTDIDFTADLAEPPPARTSTNVTRSTRPAPMRPESQRIERKESGSQHVRPSDASSIAADVTPQPQPRLPVAPGRVLCDRYVLTQIIGIGGMCTVFQARDLEALPGSERPAFVALKTPRADYADSARAIERLKREFDYAQRLSHVGIAQAFELANEGDVWFMTMELLEGESLASIMRRQGSALAPYLVRRVLRGIADSIAYAHACGIAHGDLNPANVFVMSGERVKLIDFAAACGPGEQPTGAATLAYASPQVLDGAAPEARDDVFSFACIAYEMLTGRHPFDRRPSNVARSENLRPEPPNVANEHALALMSALSFDRAARPTDIKALAKTLAPDPQRVRAPILDPEVDLPPPEPHNDLRWWVFAAVCVVTMIAAVVLTRS